MAEWHRLEGGDRPAGENRRGSFRGWPGRSPFSLSALSRGALIHHPQTGGGTACGSRALSEGQPHRAFLPCPVRTYQQTTTAAYASDAAASITGGLGAISRQQTAPGIYRGIAYYYYQHLKKKVVNCLQWWYSWFVSIRQIGDLWRKI